MFTLSIRTGNAAFTDDETGTPMPLPEVARILHQLADRIGEDGSRRVLAEQHLYDVGGNQVGGWSLT